MTSNPMNVLLEVTNIKFSTCTNNHCTELSQWEESYVCQTVTANKSEAEIESTNDNQKKAPVR